jgi:hypothetical protein
MSKGSINIYHGITPTDLRILKYHYAKKERVLSLFVGKSRRKRLMQRKNKLLSVWDKIR